MRHPEEWLALRKHVCEGYFFSLSLSHSLSLSLSFRDSAYMSRRRSRERENPKQTDSVLSTEHRAQCKLSLTTLRSQPEPKSRVSHLTKWATQVPQAYFFFNLSFFLFFFPPFLSPLLLLLNQRLGTPGGLSWLSVCLWLRSWSRVLGWSPASGCLRGAYFFLYVYFCLSLCVSHE